MKRAILLCALLFTQAAHAANDDCRVAHPVPHAGEEIRWSGACKDQLAEGAGVLLLHRPGKPDLKFDVTLLHGEISGEGTMSRDDGYRYTGTFKDGIPDGKGYFHYPDGHRYEGDVAHRSPDGIGTGLSPDGTRYEGHWKAGKWDGAGRVTYALGGSYEGEWKQGKFDGKGVLTYAGSGRRFEGEFSNGVPLGAPPKAPLPGTKYTLKEEQPHLGSNIARDAVIAPVPPTKPYEALTAEQKDVVRSAYPALDPEDEPPYPLNGPKELFAALQQASSRLNATGALKLYVQVGADGKAKAVSAIGSPDPELTRFASMALLVQKYKPAICHGVPCEMIYPLSFKFTMD
jgi:hypothetical protein